MPAALATVTTAGATPADATPVVDELAAGTTTMIALPLAGNLQPLAIAANAVVEEAEGVGKEEEEPTARRPIARQATSAPGTAAASPSETIYPGATAAPPSTAIRKEDAEGNAARWRAGGDDESMGATAPCHHLLQKKQILTAPPWLNEAASRYPSLSSDGAGCLPKL
uniref:Uncharacterized protein n=1 Tax=Heterosigma akashiwo TaxID=2829 RepID=A0A7S3Y3H8_HETAK